MVFAMSLTVLERRLMSSGLEGAWMGTRCSWEQLYPQKFWTADVESVPNESMDVYEPYLGNLGAVIALQILQQ